VDPSASFTSIISERVVIRMHIVADNFYESPKARSSRSGIQT
jgi:hypothetical protein